LCLNKFSRNDSLQRHMVTCHGLAKKSFDHDVPKRLHVASTQFPNKASIDERTKFTLDLMDHLKTHGAHGCSDLGDLCKRFLTTNPNQWGGTLGEECAYDLCQFVSDQERSEANADHVNVEDRPVHGDATRESLKILCRQQINQHGGGHTKEDIKKTQRAARVLECCCKMDKQIGRGLTNEELALHMNRLQEAAKQNEPETQDTGSESDESERDDTGPDSEDNDTTSMETSDDEATDSDEDNGTTMDDETLKEAMGDIMYICCQRPRKRRHLLKKLNRQTVKEICYCCEAVLKGDIPINGEEKGELIPHKKILRELRDGSLSTDEKKDIIVQSGGGFLLSLVPTVIGALASMFR
jgi:hypothetical protein